MLSSPIRQPHNQGAALSEPHKAIGSRIRRARTRAQLTQQQLAVKLGVRYQQIQRYERGEAFTLDRLVTIAVVLQTDLPWVFRPVYPMRLGFYGRNATGKRVDVDNHAKAICGLAPSAPAQLMWQDWFDRLHPDDVGMVDDELGRLHDPAHGTFSAYYRLRGHDGIERVILDIGHMTFEDNRAKRLQGMMMEMAAEARDEKLEAILRKIT